MDLVVGFDLDMTLLDTRPGVGATYRALVEKTGVPIDVDLAVGRLGPPLEAELANWFPAERVTWAAATYRGMYPRYAIDVSHPLPGARRAVAAVRAAGGRVVVITAKKTEFAVLHLDHVGIEADEVVGLAFADGKRDALVRLGVSVYVGDHVADMLAAGSAGGVTAVGVTTGPCDRQSLLDAGAHAVLHDLTALPDLLRQLPQSQSSDQP